MKAAVAWSSAALRQRAARSTGTVHGATVSLSETPRIFTMASLAMLSYFLHSACRLVGSLCGDWGRSGGVQTMHLVIEISCH